MDIGKVIQELENAKFVFKEHGNVEPVNPKEYYAEKEQTITDAITLLKEQDELLQKKQKDIERLCTEISELKHRLHDEEC